jgi:type III secretion system FlhB-like substrate exporter
VPVVHDPALTRALPEVAVGDEIPTRLYAPVAEVLRDIGVRASTSGQ